MARKAEQELMMLEKLTSFDNIITGTLFDNVC
jgi:hypothetical protein